MTTLYCSCQTIRTDAAPEYCSRCETFTHPVYNPLTLVPPKLWRVNDKRTTLLSAGWRL